MTPELTQAQKTTFKAAITAEPAVAAFLNVNDYQSIANYYNGLASPVWTVWRDLAMDTVANLVVLANMTPVDAVPTDTALNVAIWQARSLSCQGKQFSYQLLSQGRTIANMKRSGFRASLQDCLTNVPAGVAGASVSAGWVAVRDAAKFSANRAEKLLSTGTGSVAVPADLGPEGSISTGEIDRIMTEG